MKEKLPSHLPWEAGRLPDVHLGQVHGTPGSSEARLNSTSRCVQEELAALFSDSGDESDKNPDLTGPQLQHPPPWGTRVGVPPEIQGPNEDASESDASPAPSPQDALQPNTRPCKICDVCGSVFVGTWSCRLCSKIELGTTLQQRTLHPTALTPTTLKPNALPVSPVTQQSSLTALSPPPDLPRTACPRTAYSPTPHHKTSELSLWDGCVHERSSSDGSTDDEGSCILRTALNSSGSGGCVLLKT